MKIDRKKVFDKFDGRCAYCGDFIYKDNFQVDHFIPKARFDSRIKNGMLPRRLNHVTEVDHIDNLMPACRVCNNWKRDMNIELFRREIEAQIERLNKNHANYRFAKRYGLIRETKRPIKFYFEQIDTRKHLQEIIEDDEKDGLYGDSFKNEQNKD